MSPTGKTLISEKEVEVDCLTWLNLNGWYAFKTPNRAASINGVYIKANAMFEVGKGLQDALAIKNGLTIYLEFKKPVGGRQSEEQKAFQQQIEKKAGHYLLIRSKEELLIKLRERDLL